MISRLSQISAPLARSAARGMATRFAPSHEWISIDGDVGTVGITDYAQNALGDVAYVDLPAVGDAFEAGEVFGGVESTKAVSDVYAPMGGEVVAVNEVLEEEYGLINSSPMVDGWLIKLKLSDQSQADALMEEVDYARHLEEAEH